MFMWHLSYTHQFLPAVGLCPKMPLKKQGMRMLPPMSDPTPITEAPLPIILPSPPEKR